MRSTATITAAILLAVSAHAAFAAPAAHPAKRPRVKPLSAVTVKVSPDRTARPIRISTVDRDSCTVWVNRDDELLEIAALRACRAAMAQAAQKGGAR